MTTQPLSALTMLLSRHTRRRELGVTTVLVDTETVEVAMADRRSALSTEVFEHLFEPFVSTQNDGMGLGLLILGKDAEEFVDSCARRAA